MASEDLGYWTFRGSDVRALLFYLSGDVQEKGGGWSKSGVEAGRRERDRYKRRRKTERPRRDTEGDGNGGRTVRGGGGGGLTLNHPLVFSPSPPSSSCHVN